DRRPAIQLHETAVLPGDGRPADLHHLPVAEGLASRRVAPGELEIGMQLVVVADRRLAADQRQAGVQPDVAGGIVVNYADVPVILRLAILSAAPAVAQCASRIVTDRRPAVDQSQAA